jgi:aspartyl-tRNA(Asn)/glutamyl-tRNA(Gln) amidotransferase subunit C
MLDPEALDPLCRLARIRLPEGEARGLQRDLERILDYVDSLRGLETTGIDPSALDPARPARFRQDQVGSSLSRDEALGGAPRIEDGHFAVPPVVVREEDR